jgi:hypothetical protein
MSDHPAGSPTRERATLIRVVLIAGAVVSGLTIATIHPLGILLGGMLTGVFTRTLSRGVLAGAGFGGLVVVVFVANVWATGSLGRVSATTDIAVLPVVIAIVLGAVGGLAQGLR